MNTDNANKFLDERQIYQRDVWDSNDIEHPLDCLLEDYHQEQLKLLGIGISDVVKQSEQCGKGNCNRKKLEGNVYCSYHYDINFGKHN